MWAASFAWLHYFDWFSQILGESRLVRSNWRQTYFFRFPYCFCSHDEISITCHFWYNYTHCIGCWLHVISNFLFWMSWRNGILNGSNDTKSEHRKCILFYHAQIWHEFGIGCTYYIRILFGRFVESLNLVVVRKFGVFALSCWWPATHWLHAVRLATCTVLVHLVWGLQLFSLVWNYILS